MGPSFLTLVDCPRGPAIRGYSTERREARDDAGEILAFGAGREVQRHAVFQDRLGKRDDVVDRRREPAVDQGLGANGQHQGLAGARARTPSDETVGVAIGACAGSCRTHELQDRFDDLIGNGDLPDEALRRHQLLRRNDGFEFRRLVAGRRVKHSALGDEIGIADVDLQEEAVELSFGQRIGALLLERVLRREHVERRRRVVALSGDRNMMLLHRLQQRRLRLRRRAVDFIGHQKLREDRSLDETERAAAARFVLEHFRTDDVGGHQVGRELDALGIKAENLAERIDEQRLGETWHTDQKCVAAREDRYQRPLDDFVLSEDDGRGRLVGALNALGRGFEARHDIGVGLDNTTHLSKASLNALLLLKTGPSIAVPAL